MQPARCHNEWCLLEFESHIRPWTLREPCYFAMPWPATPGWMMGFDPVVALGWRGEEWTAAAHAVEGVRGCLEWEMHSFTLFFHREKAGCYQNVTPVDGVCYGIWSYDFLFACWNDLKVMEKKTLLWFCYCVVDRTNHLRLISIYLQDIAPVFIDFEHIVRELALYSGNDLYDWCLDNINSVFIKSPTGVTWKPLSYRATW